MYVTPEFPNLKNYEELKNFQSEFKSKLKEQTDIFDVIKFTVLDKFIFDEISNTLRKSYKNFTEQNDKYGEIQKEKSKDNEYDPSKDTKDLCRFMEKYVKEFFDENELNVYVAKFESKNLSISDIISVEKMEFIAGLKEFWNRIDAAISFGDTKDELLQEMTKLIEASSEPVSVKVKNIEEKISMSFDILGKCLATYFDLLHNNNTFNNQCIIMMNDIENIYRMVNILKNFFLICQKKIIEYVMKMLYLKEENQVLMIVKTDKNVAPSADEILTGVEILHTYLYKLEIYRVNSTIPYYMYTLHKIDKYCEDFEDSNNQNEIIQKINTLIELNRNILIKNIFVKKPSEQVSKNLIEKPIEKHKNFMTVINMLNTKYGQPAITLSYPMTLADMKQMWDIMKNYIYKYYKDEFKWTKFKWTKFEYDNFNTKKK